MMRVLLRGVLCSAIFAGSSALTFTLVEKAGSRDLMQALQARDAGKYTQSAALMQQGLKKAKDNEIRSRVYAEMGKMALRGNLPQATAAQGVAWLHQAEKLGNPAVAMSLGNAYHYGKGVTADKVRAEGYYRKALAENPRAYYELAVLHQNTPEALALFRQFVGALEVQGAEVSPASALLAARQFQRGELGVVNAQEAEKWYRLAAKRGSRSAAMELGYLYAGGKGAAPDIQKAEIYFQQAVKADAKLAYRIAKFYEKTALPQAGAKAVQWMQFAAAQGMSDAMLRLGGYYRKGLLVAKNEVLARQYVQQAAGAGNPRAIALLAKIEVQDQRRRAYAAKHAATKSTSKSVSAKANLMATESVKLAAQQGDAAAMQALGRAYLYGQGVVQDNVIGMEWLEKSADAGNTAAMMDIAGIYVTGTRAGYDMRKAHMWYRRAAEKDMAEAQYQLGMGYLHGMGVEKDMKKAKEWLTKAARHSYSAARAMLNTLNEKQ